MVIKDGNGETKVSVILLEKKLSSKQKLHMHLDIKGASNAPSYRKRISR